jgi:hypothetical protein
MPTAEKHGILCLQFLARCYGAEKKVSFPLGVLSYLIEHCGFTEQQLEFMEYANSLPNMLVRHGMFLL